MTDDSLIIFKLCGSAMAFFAVFISAVSVALMLTWKGQGEKLIQRGSHYAAGVFLGTATIHFLGGADGVFRQLVRRVYPREFALAIAGYLMAMLVDFIVSYAVTRFIMRSNRKAHARVHGKLKGMKPTTSSNTIPLPDTSQLESQECDGIDYLPCLTLYRVTLLGDCLVLLVAFSFHSGIRGLEIASATSEDQALRSLLNTTLHDIIYSVSVILTLLRAISIDSIVECCFFSCYYALMSPCGVILGLIMYVPPVPHNADLWILAIYMGLSSGIFIYVSVNHLLADGYQMETKSIFKGGFNKLVPMILGIGVVAFLKVVDSY